MSKLWVEKYRPSKIDDVMSQGQVTCFLRRVLDGGDLPHLLFYGPPGTGKTSTILALSLSMFGENGGRVLEFNASDERGIETIREKVKTFSRKVTCDNEKTPGLKLIILDEADSMTSEAQAALRRIMEVYSKTTRFCILCNYVHKIIEPLRSRCAKFRFKAVSLDNGASKLMEICQKEGVPASEDVIRYLISRVNGDLRKSINYIQNANDVVSSMVGTEVTRDVVDELIGTVPEDVISRFYGCVSNVEDIRNFLENHVIRCGYSGIQFVDQFHDFTVGNSSISSLHKSLICVKLARVAKALMEGSDQFLQLLDLGSFIHRIYNKNISINGLEIL